MSNKEYDFSYLDYDKPKQSTLFDDMTQEELVKKMWDNKYPCPCCDVGKLEFSKTHDRLFISCFNCHTSFIREYSKGEYNGKFD